jgi:hypothetical protein
VQVAALEGKSLAEVEAEAIASQEAIARRKLETLLPTKRKVFYKGYSSQIR